MDQLVVVVAAAANRVVRKAEIHRVSQISCLWAEAVVVWPVAGHVN